MGAAHPQPWDMGTTWGSNISNTVTAGEGDRASHPEESYLVDEIFSEQNPRIAEPPGIPEVGEGLLRCSSFPFLPHAQSESDQQKAHALGHCQQLWGELGSGKDVYSFIQLIHWFVHQTFIKHPPCSRECSKAHQTHRNPCLHSHRWRQAINRSVDKTDRMLNGDKLYGENWSRNLRYLPMRNENIYRLKVLYKNVHGSFISNR